MNTDGPPSCGGQWSPCVGEKEEWVLVIADLGRAPNRLGKGQATGGLGSPCQCLGSAGRKEGAGGAAQQKSETLSREKVEEPERDAGEMKGGRWLGRKQVRAERLGGGPEKPGTLGKALAAVPGRTDSASFQA